MAELLCAVLYGILEGITEWLPVSSTGHLILLDRVVRLPVREAFFSLFEVVIQLGAILAVAVLYGRRLWPFGRSRVERTEVLRLWARIALATLPSVVAGLLLDDLLESHLHTPAVVATMLIVYGVAFLFLEKWQKRTPFVGELGNIPLHIAFWVGCFQVLALIPGTSRSGATILGGMLVGLARPAAAEFSFFLGIPTMLGAGVLRCAKFFGAGLTLTSREALILAVGALTAFVTSLFVIRFLIEFVRRHSFAPFGIYRILLGGAVLCAALSGVI